MLNITEFLNLFSINYNQHLFKKNYINYILSFFLAKKMACFDYAFGYKYSDVSLILPLWALVLIQSDGINIVSPYIQKILALGDLGFS